MNVCAVLAELAEVAEVAKAWVRCVTNEQLNCWQVYLPSLIRTCRTALCERSESVQLLCFPAECILPIIQQMLKAHASGRPTSQSGIGCC